MKNLSIMALGLLSFSVFAEKFDKQNQPYHFERVAKVKFDYALSNLPLNGKLKDHRLGWSDTFWPSNLGGIAYRWNSTDPQSFKYKTYSKKDLLSMTPGVRDALLETLSPAELYDIYNSDYSYGLTKKVLGKYHAQDLWWEGICHGWALAAIHFPEPKPVRMTNKEGIEVAFGSADVKGLLGMYHAFNNKGVYARIGARCDAVGKVEGEAFEQDEIKTMPDSKEADKPSCRDTNAGAFHVAITNMIGKHSLGFVADVDRFNDVWNQPVIGYDSEFFEEIPASVMEYKSGIAKKVRVKTQMHYGDELEFYSDELAHEGEVNFVTKEPVINTIAQTVSTRHYEYILELDSFGKVVGGEWISESRPDMIWTKAKDPQFLGKPFPLQKLSEIYKPIDL